jgi:hypothetical protein
VKSTALRFRPGEEKCQPGPKISEKIEKNLRLALKWLLNCSSCVAPDLGVPLD